MNPASFLRLPPLFKLTNKTSKRIMNNRGEMGQPCCTPVQLLMASFCVLSFDPTVGSHVFDSHKTLDTTSRAWGGAFNPISNSIRASWLTQSQALQKSVWRMVMSLPSATTSINPSCIDSTALSMDLPANIAFCLGEITSLAFFFFFFFFETNFLQLVVLNLSHLNYIKLCLFLTSNER